MISKAGAPKVTVQIGDTEMVFELWRTSAPPAYDHGWTMTLVPEAVDSMRIVMVQEDAVEWSKGRYGSGMYAFVPADPWMQELAEQMLWERINSWTSSREQEVK